LEAAGDPELTDFVTTSSDRAELESSMKFGGGAFSNIEEQHTTTECLDDLPGLEAWAVRAATAAGFETDIVTHTFSDVDGWAAARYEVVARIYLYVVEPTQRQVSIASTLRSWPESGLRDTAFSRIYGIRADEPAEATRRPRSARRSCSPLPSRRLCCARGPPASP
jgi:hypothetical protein